MLNYSAANPPPKSRITNKRIAFPLSTNTSSTANQNQTLPNLPPLAQPLTKPPSTLDSTCESVCQLLNSEQSRQNFENIWKGQLPEQFQKTVSLMVGCLTGNNKEAAKLHKETLLTEYKTLCDGWIDGINF
ncbi:uncharacterized protein LOC114336408 isoform X2 [Diabrotica virgifera virgifera]|nr:uncharacterized protein LOC114336408 isoform X2 [Diabrotica virgifera virgifera]